MPQKKSISDSASYTLLAAHLTAWRNSEGDTHLVIAVQMLRFLAAEQLTIAHLGLSDAELRALQLQAKLLGVEIE